MHKKATAAEGFCFVLRSQPQDVGTMFGRVYWWSGNCLISLRNRTDVSDGLHLGVILSLSGSGIAGCHMLPVLVEFTRFLGIGPRLRVDFDCGLWFGGLV